MPSMTGGTMGSGAIGSNVVIDVAGWAETKAFIARIGVLATVVALEVQAEPTTITNDANRKALAKSVLQYPSDALVKNIAQAVLGDLTTTPAADDQDLLTRVEHVWDAVAGVL